MKYTKLYLLLFAALLASCSKDLDVPADGDVVVDRVGGKFTVGEGKQVFFSPGNLQYNAVTHIWRFAENQYDCIADGNAYISSYYDGWIDLFGWGTSGFIVSPYCASTEPDDYEHDGQGIENNNNDWGRFVTISNAGSGARMWRTLSSSEWEYLLETRNKAKEKYAPALVCDYPGLVILSDNFHMPDSCIFAVTFDNGYESNIYNEHQWRKMEAAGAIFLPAAGYRLGDYVDEVDMTGTYWTSSYFEDGTAYAFSFDDYEEDLSIPPLALHYGLAVRLVRDAK
ncbi:MAG: hypothetical protein K5867_10955 [Bacteroidales bacterium]|nr:hypothetical protein [Bacteroidales bacterium]